MVGGGGGGGWVGNIFKNIIQYYVQHLHTVYAFTLEMHRRGGGGGGGWVGNIFKNILQYYNICILFMHLHWNEIISFVCN